MSKRLAIVVVVFLAIATIFFSYYASRATVSYEFEDFFPASSPEVTYFQEFRQQFETDNDFIMLAVVQNEGLFQDSFLADIHQLTQGLKKLPYVVDVNGPTTLKRVKKEPLSGRWIASNVLSRGQSDYSRDSTKIYNDPTLVPTFFSRDGKVVNLIIKHKQRLSKRKGDELNAQIDDLLQNYTFDAHHRVGRSVAQSFYIDVMARELALFTSISAVIAFLFLYATYRNVWSVIVPMAIVLLSAVWTVGWMTLIGKPLDIMLTVLPTILFIVGISDVIHLYTKFLFLKREGMSKHLAIRKTMKDVGLATLLTSVTTAIGFSTLYFIQIPIVQEFGLVLAFGVLITFFITFLAFSSFLTLTPERYFSQVVQSDFWRKRLARGYIYSLRKGRTILLVVLGLSAVAFAGLMQIDQKNVLLEDLPDDNPLFEEVAFFDQNIVGMRPFEMGLNLKDSNRSFLDYEILVELDKIDQYLQEDYQVQQLMSVSMLAKKIHFDLNRSKKTEFKLPDENQWKNYRKELTRKRAREQLGLLVNDENRIARFTARTSDLGSDYFKSKNADFAKFFKANNLDQLFTYNLTGSAALIDLSNALLSYNLLMGLLLAFALVALLTGLVFKSFKLIGVILFINMVPLIGIAGIMGALGIDLKISTSVIFTIAYGIAVDDSIHFMSKFKLEYRNDKSLLYAFKRTYLSTGRAIVLTTLILMGGFVILIFSSFKGTLYIGILVSSTLLLALLVDLFLLPFLLAFTFKNKSN